MNLKNLKIGTQLRIGFAAMLFFVIVLGVVSYLQSGKIHLQTETMYNHPLLVRRAIGMLHSDILGIHRDMKDLFLSANKEEIALDLNQIETGKANAFEKIDILYSQYLGPRTDVDSVKQTFIKLNSICEETIRLFRAGKTSEAVNQTKAFRIGGKQVGVVLAALQKIDDFSTNKGDTLFADSRELNNSLHRQLILLVAVILLLSLIIYYVLLRNIHKPLDEMTDVTQHFHNGDLDARSSYASKNEFGVLSASFNTLAESIQMNMDLNEKAANLAGLMLSEEDAKKFFQSTLNALSVHTGSQIAAVYLLSDDKKSFEHFESIGADDNARQSFSAGSFEGEFGSVLSSRKVQYIKNIPEDTRFVFHTVNGKFIPHEIITIPILAGKEVIAIISIASVSIYSKQSIQLIDDILVTLSARVEGILAYRKIKEFSEKLEQQNSELETQKTELALQSAELTEQNTELGNAENAIGRSQPSQNQLPVEHEPRTAYTT